MDEPRKYSKKAQLSNLLKRALSDWDVRSSSFAGDRFPRASADEQKPVESEAPQSEEQPPSNHEVAQTLSPEDEQERREDAYVRFHAQETIEDYTTGPSRLVAGHDGVRTCATLLLTYDLSQLVKNAIDAWRIHAQEERHAEQQLEVIDKFEDQVQDEISNHELRILEAKEVNEEAPDAEREASIESWRSAIEVLRGILSNLKCKKENLEANVRWKVKVTLEAQAEVTALLDEAFVVACLIEPEDGGRQRTIEQFDLHDQYQKQLLEIQEEDRPASPRVVFANAPEQLDTIPAIQEYVPQPPTEEELAKKALFEAFWQAQDRVNLAKASFDNRVYEQARDQEENYQAELAGKPTAYESLDHFDLHWVQVNQQLTHELIEAEEAYSQAKSAAIEAGVKLQSDDQSSCFGDDFDCAGYPMSEEVDVEGAIAWLEPRIDCWLQNVPEDADSASEISVEVDEWDFKELDLSDSLSCVDYGKRRKRIDRWQRDCQVAGEDVVCDQ